ncbi:MAG: zinc ribbon domain-containing protein [Chloroflexi bacterium]|nr:zinc ribbon domain-containing protein [Chloroflexota bacterium]
MSNTTLTYSTDLNEDIVLMAAEQVGDDLGWENENEESREVTLKPPKDYAKHAVTFKILVGPKSEGGSQVTVRGHMSGLFTDKSPLEEESARLKDLIESKGSELTQKAIEDGYMCPTCGRLIEPGLLRCPHDGTPMPRHH